MIKELGLAILAVIACQCLTAFPQEGLRDFPKEQVIEANKQLDSVLRDVGSTHRVEFDVSTEQRQQLINKYLRESDRSPYFWSLFRVRLAEHYEATDCKGCQSLRPPQRRAESAIRMSVLRTSEEEWGDLILKSEPSGASVYLAISSNRTYEGNTKLTRRYPENSYTFSVEMKGYKPRSITVSINKDNPIEELVKLEKQ